MTTITQLPLFNDTEPPMKRCSKCSEFYPLTAEFWKLDNKRKDGFSSWCKQCKREYDLEYNKKNIEKRKQQAKEWTERNPEKTDEYHRRYKQSGKAQERNKRYYQENAESIKAKVREYQKGNRETINATKRRYRQNNLDDMREKERIYRKNNSQKNKQIQQRYKNRNREKLREAGRQYQREHRDKEKTRQYKQENPEKVAIGNHKRRARKIGNGGQHTHQELVQLYHNQDRRCFHCGKFISLKNGQTRHIDHWIPYSKGGTNNIENIRLLCPFCNLSKGAKLPCDWDKRYCE